MARDILEELVLALRKMRRKMRPKKPVGKCHPAEFVTLAEIQAFVEEQPDRSGITVGELTERLEVSMPAVSRMLGKLEEKQLIARHFGDGNRRTVFVQLTDKGSEILAEAAEQERCDLAAVLEVLGDEDADHLLRIMRKLAEVEVDEC